MKRMLMFLLIIVFFSCKYDVPFSQKTVEKEDIKKLQEETKKAYFGFEPSLIGDSSINAKLLYISQSDLDVTVKAIESLNCTIKSIKDGIRENEKYVHIKALGDYPSTLRELRKLEKVVFAEPDYIIRDVGKIQNNNVLEKDEKVLILKNEGLGKPLNDTELEGRCYSLEITEALRAYKKFGFGENKVWVGIIDGGTNANHDDLKYEDGSNVVKVLKSAYDDSGHVLDSPMEVLSGNSDADKGQGHGTHCTGILAAVGNNEKGIAGVAWKNVNLVSYKVLYEGAGTSQTIYSSLKALVDDVRTRVSESEQRTVPCNLSLGGGKAEQFPLEIINYALSKGVLPIIAMGNDGQHIQTYPAAFPGVLSVGATDGKDEKANFSTSGEWINVVAPGQAILSLDSKEKSLYTYKSGTSMATPFVTGMVAYLLSFNPHLTPYQIITLLEETADKVDSDFAKYDEKGFSLSYGYGRVNVYEATKRVKEGKLPEVGKNYVETTLKIEVPLNDEPIYLYDENVLITITLAKDISGKYIGEIRGLLPKDYDVVYKGVAKRITIDNSDDVSVAF